MSLLNLSLSHDAFTLPACLIRRELHSTVVYPCRPAMEKTRMTFRRWPNGFIPRRRWVYLVWRRQTEGQCIKCTVAAVVAGLRSKATDMSSPSYRLDKHSRPRYMMNKKWLHNSMMRRMRINKTLWIRHYTQTHTNKTVKRTNEKTHMNKSDSERTTCEFICREKKAIHESQMEMNNNNDNKYIL